jgi:hypothetical protein
LTSREDPFPSVVLEALAVGLPVVAFRGRTGQDELLERGRCCLVDDVTVAAFADGVSRAVDRLTPEDSALRTQLIRDEFHFQKYVMDLLAPTPAAMRRISVVVPNYGYEELIGDRLRQILAQTYPVYELIVLDDASPDDSVRVISETLADAEVPVRIEVNADNSGSVFAQWAKGAALATGDLVWIAEADDVAEPDFLERMVAPFLLDDETAMAYCQSRQIGPNGELLAEDYHAYVADVPGRDWDRPYRASGPDETATCFAVKNVVPNVSAVLFAAAALRRSLTSLDLASLPTAGDWRVYVEVLRDGSVAYQPTALNSHRRHPSSVVARNLGRPHLVEIMQVQAEICATFDVSPEVRAAALAYDEVLYEQLGIGERSRFRQDEALADLVSSVSSG